MRRQTSDLGCPVVSLARPGGNVTAVSSQTSALAGRQFDVLKEIAPGAGRFGVLCNEKNPGTEAFREAATRVATSMRVALIESRANDPGELGTAARRPAREGVQAVVVPADPMMPGARGALSSLLAMARRCNRSVTSRAPCRPYTASGV